MNTKISSGLKTLFLIHFIMGLIFGLVNLLDPAGFYKLLGVPVTDPAPYRLLGGALLGFAAGSWFGYRATNWEQVRIIVLTELVWPPVGALVSLLLALGSTPGASAWWLNVVILAGFAIAFYIYYSRQEAAPAVAAPAPRAAAPKAHAVKAAPKKAARRRRARA